MGDFEPRPPGTITPPPRPANRLIASAAVHSGKQQRWYTDLYAFLLRIGWFRLLMIYIVLFLSVNALFASLYVGVGSCIKGARPGHWGDAFFFSVQTLSTIGYGGMTPIGLKGNLLVTLESMIGIIGVALSTGLVFAKFARPTARVLFSRTAVLSPYNGTPALKFRLANQRGTNIVEAALRVSALVTEISEEGHRLRRLYDLDIIRNTTPVFVMSWLVIHPIDETSPLFGMTPQDLKEQDVRIIITLTGIDGVFSQTIHKYHVYWGEDVLCDMDFVDVLESLPNKQIRIHFPRFHDVYPIETKADER